VPAASATDTSPSGESKSPAAALAISADAAKPMSADDATLVATPSRTRPIPAAPATKATFATVRTSWRLFAIHLFVAITI